MCGRFSLFSDSAVIADYFDIDHLNALTPRYNIAPSQQILIIRENDHGLREAAMVRWGLVPTWTKKDQINNKLINARVETAHEKPSFRSAFKKRRCIVVADGFYEWQTVPGAKTKQPYHIASKSDAPLAFAGLWEHWQHQDEVIESGTILTTAADEQILPIHQRMPVMLSPDDVETWLAHDNMDVAWLQHFLMTTRAPRLRFTPVSSAVNNPRHDQPDCIQDIG